jgi:RNAse (barnase) inhibitor barstar
MNDWKNIFDSYLNSGVYNAGIVRKNSIIKKIVAKNGLNYSVIDTKKVTNKTDFLKIVARSLDFPAYFGTNWDALNECLTDMSWKPARGYVIVFTNFRAVRENLGSDIKILEKIFDSSLQYWKKQRIGFYIILSE